MINYFLETSDQIIREFHGGILSHMEFVKDNKFLENNNRRG